MRSEEFDLDDTGLPGNKDIDAIFTIAAKDIFEEEAEQSRLMTAISAGK